jgi:predicted HAD superfamily Cof-like phosphohydrolase
VSKDPYSRMVREFHEAFGLMVRDTPDVGDPKERELRVRLMLEEVLEFAKAAGVEIDVLVPGGTFAISRIGHLEISATGEPDLVAMAHELADCALVVHGTGVQLGIPLLASTEEVHGANMRKVGPDGRPIVDERGKVRKPPGWRPADVGAVLKRLNEGEE